LYKGIGVCEGIVISEAFVIEKEELVFESHSKLTSQEELSRYNQAVEKFIGDTLLLAEKVAENAGSEQAMILEGHTIIVQDPEIEAGVSAELEGGPVTAEAAVASVFSMFADIFASMDDELMKERAHDLEDIKTRLIEILTGKVSRSIEDIKTPCVIIARDMTPSETGRINKAVVKGVVTEVGGITSHMAIMAKAMELPTVLGIESMTAKVKTGDTIAINGGTGEVIVSPSDEELEKLKKLQAEFEVYKKELEVYKTKSSVTLDGVHVEIAANIGSANELDAVLENGAEGIGLFRTEFLFMERNSLPDEEAQFEVYKKVAETMAGKPVIIRTLDIGGDKDVPYLNMEKEENPFLGYRAIRLCLGDLDMFKVQLRALLRAGHYGNVKIMVPMITTITELRQTKEIIEELKIELEKEGKPFGKDIEVGIMIETPASSLIADILAKECDFFSIGTNDLTQYTMATDRGNERVQYLYSTFEPAVIRSIYNVIKAGKDAGIMVGMCGEGAGDVNMIPFLLGCGLDEFSMSAGSVPGARKAICSLSKSDMEKELDKILSMATREEILSHLKTLAK